MTSLVIVRNTAPKRGYFSAVLPRDMDPGSAIRENLAGKWLFMYLLGDNDLQNLLDPLEEDLPGALDTVPQGQRVKNGILNVRAFSIDIDLLPSHGQGDNTQYAEFEDPNAYKVTLAQLNAATKPNNPSG